MICFRTTSRPAGALLLLFFAVLTATGQTARTASVSQWKVTETELSLAEFRALHCEGSRANRLTGYTGIQRKQADPVLGKFAKCRLEGIELKDAFSASAPIPMERTVIPWDAIAVVECNEPKGPARRKRIGAAVAAGTVAAGLAIGFREQENAGVLIGLGGLGAALGIAATPPQHRLRIRILD